MSLLRITKYGEAVLKHPTQPVQDLNQDIQKLINDMYETMYSAYGIGLAAPQVNFPYRLAVINVTPEKKENQFVVINPRIVKRQETIESEEGCLSLPGVGGVHLKRSAKVVVEAINEKGMPITIKADGLLARCLQHEIDHLDGKMILHRAPLKRKLEMLWQIRKLKKEKLW